MAAEKKPRREARLLFNSKRTLPLVSRPLREVLRRPSSKSGRPRIRTRSAHPAPCPSEGAWPPATPATIMACRSLYSVSTRQGSSIPHVAPKALPGRHRWTPRRHHRSDRTEWHIASGKHRLILPFPAYSEARIAEELIICDLLRPRRSHMLGLVATNRPMKPRSICKSSEPTV